MSHNIHSNQRIVFCFKNARVFQLRNRRSKSTERTDKDSRCLCENIIDWCGGGGKQLRIPLLLLLLNKNSKQQILFREIFGETTTRTSPVVFVYFEYYFDGCLLVYFPASALAGSARGVADTRSLTVSRSHALSPAACLNQIAHPPLRYTLNTLSSV